MTLLSVVRDVCAGVGVTFPNSVFVNLASNRTMQEMLALANEMAQRIAYDNRDWTKLRKVAVCVGDGTTVDGVQTGTTAFDLPADYQRMLLTSNVYWSNQFNPLSFIANTDDWMIRRAANRSMSNGEWTLLGGQLHIYPIIPTGQTAFYAYMHRNCVALGAGGFGDSFMADNDRFVLDERLLKLGMIWQWKAWKGTPYVEDLGTFEDALSFAQGHDGPAPTIVHRPPELIARGGWNVSGQW